jgi:hypothetical protein
LANLDQRCLWAERRDDLRLAFLARDIEGCLSTSEH